MSTSTTLHIAQPSGNEPARPERFFAAAGTLSTPTVLVVSQERVGRAFIVQTVRNLGLHTLVADTAGQAVSRFNTGHHCIHGVIVVGELADGTGASLQRWLRNEGLTDLPVIGIGTDLMGADVWATTCEVGDWNRDSARMLKMFGLTALEALAA